MKYWTMPNNLPLPDDDAPPAGSHRRTLLPLAVDYRRRRRLSSSGGGKSTPPTVMAPQETDQHAGYVFMMQQGSGNGGSSTTSRENQSSDHGAVEVKPFILDSGATVHATGDVTLLSDLEDTTTNMRVCTADGTMLEITGQGTVHHHNITLHDVQFVPGLDVNIVSVSKLGELLDYTVVFTPSSCFIRDPGWNLVGKGQLVNGLFELDYLNVPRI